MARIPLDDQMAEWWDLGADLNDGSIQADTLRAAQREIRDNALGLMRKHTGSDLKLSNFYRRTRRSESADLGFEIERTQSKMIFSPPGLWGLVEGGAKPHLVGNKSKAGRRLVIPIGPGKNQAVTGPVRHPGMRPLGRPVRDTLKTIMPTWSKEFEKQVDRRI